jgi:hypothetical protein
LSNHGVRSGKLMTEKLQMASGGLDAFHRVYLRMVDERAR